MATSSVEKLPPPGRAVWFFAAGAWTLLGVLAFAQQVAFLEYRGLAYPLAPMFAWIMADWWTCGIFTPAFYWMARRFPIRARTLRVAIPMHILGGLVFLVLKVAIALPIWRWINPDIERSYLTMLLGSAFIDYLGYWTVVGVVHAIEYYREAQAGLLVAVRLDGELRAAELENLKAQLHPHFLFNTLQGISTLIHRDPPAADRMLNDLSDLLRVSLKHTAAQEVALRDEIAFLGRYLDIMRVRFGDRLAIDLDVASDVLDARVPSLVLQPLAENAIRHGMADRQDRGRVTVRGRRSGESLVLEVADDGVGLPRDGQMEGNGIGLTNTRERLARLYGSAAKLEVTANPGLAGENTVGDVGAVPSLRSGLRPGVGTTVRLTIPYRTRA